MDSSAGIPAETRTSARRVALYGGTFDPVHHGHLILARDAVELLEVDHVIFLPAAISPHKLHSTPTPAGVRCAMLAAAIQGEPAFRLDLREIRRAGPSFTVDTVEELRQEMPGVEFMYLIGQDHLGKLATWHRYAELQTLVEFVVFGRGEPAAAGPQFRRLERRLDISATEIRARVARGASIRYFVPETVGDIISRHHLYQGVPY